MEQIVAALASIGLSRDIAVNLATDFLFTVVLGVIVAMTTNWARDRSEARNAKRLLKGAYRSADQCIVDYLCAGRVLARLAATDDPAAVSDGLDRLSRRFRDVVFEGQRFEERLGMVGGALSRSAFNEANSVSDGLAFLRDHSAQMHRDLTRSPSLKEVTTSLDVWLDVLELAAENLDGRKDHLASKRKPPPRTRPLHLKILSPPTGRLNLKSLRDDREDKVAALSSAIWRRDGVDRSEVLAVLKR